MGTSVSTFVRQVVLLGLVLVSTQAGITGTLSFQGTQGSSNCYYRVDGVCVPNRAAYGFHPAKWRRWPSALRTARDGEADSGVPDLPSGEVPRATEESDLSTSSPGEKERLLMEGARGAFEEAETPLNSPAELDSDLLENPFQDDLLQDDLFQDDPILDQLGEPQTWLERRRGRPTPADTRGPRLQSPGIMGRQRSTPTSYLSHVRRASLLEPALLETNSSIEELPGWSNPLRFDSKPTARPAVVERPAVSVTRDVRTTAPRARRANPLRGN